MRRACNVAARPTPHRPPSLPPDRPPVRRPPTRPPPRPPAAPRLRVARRRPAAHLSFAAFPFFQAVASQALICVWARGAPRTKAGTPATSNNLGTVAAFCDSHAETEEACGWRPGVPQSQTISYRENDKTRDIRKPLFAFKKIKTVEQIGPMNPASTIASPASGRRRRAGGRTRGGWQAGGGAAGVRQRNMLGVGMSVRGPLASKGLDLPRPVVGGTIRHWMLTTGATTLH